MNFNTVNMKSLHGNLTRLKRNPRVVVSSFEGFEALKESHDRNLDAL